MLRLIAGLGNPGKKYEENRHSLGYMVIDALAMGQGLVWKKDSDLMCYFARNREYVAIKPTTFMNESGESVRAVCNYFSINSKDVLVICDDLDLEFGKIRLGFNGSSAGHRGIDSVIKGLSGADFARLRIGIGRPKNEKQDPADYVLEDFIKEEKNKLPEIISRCCEAVQSWLDDGIEATMNRFN